MYSDFEIPADERRYFSSKEEWHEWIKATAGSITDESFVEYTDDICNMEAWAKKVDAMYGSIDDETFMAPDDWEKNEKILSWY